jgi:hypothetical protein
MPANGESGQSTSILGGSPSSCRMEITTSRGTPPAETIETPTIQTHCAQVVRGGSCWMHQDVPGG